MAPLLHAESALALVHMLAKPAAFTLSTFQLAMFWLNAEADWNAPSMFATLAVFQLARFALKAAAPPNALAMLTTDATFQLEMVWLNAEAN